jgi:hypothetical protein
VSIKFARRVWQIKIVQTLSGQLANHVVPVQIFQTPSEKSVQGNLRCQHRALTDLERGGFGNIRAELRGELGEVVGKNLRVV